MTECYCKILIFKRKLKEEEKTLKENSTISLNRRLSVTMKLKIIKYTEKKGAFMLHLITIEFQVLQ